MRRVVVHEIIIGAGVALLLVAALATGMTQWSLRQHERRALVVRSEFDSLMATGGPERDAVAEVAVRLERAEFEVRATRELRARLWRRDGMGLAATVAGVLVLVVGGAHWRKATGVDLS